MLKNFCKIDCAFECNILKYLIFTVPPVKFRPGSGQRSRIQRKKTVAMPKKAEEGTKKGVWSVTDLVTALDDSEAEHGKSF
jgi:hypothetical protein